MVTLAAKLQHAYPGINIVPDGDDGDCSLDKNGIAVWDTTKLGPQPTQDALDAISEHDVLVGIQIANIKAEARDRIRALHGDTDHELRNLRRASRVNHARALQPAGNLPEPYQSWEDALLAADGTIESIIDKSAAFEASLAAMTVAELEALDVTDNAYWA